MILEGVITTINQDGSPNISPMGPTVDASLSSFVLRPFATSTTYQNLKRTGQGIFHVTDDVELLAQAAIGQPCPLPEMHPCVAVDGMIIASACRWFGLQVTEIDDRQERSHMKCQVVQQETLRDFFGFNRAKHAVVEAAILATRTRFLKRDTIQREMDRLRVLVEKTAGPAEQRAFALLEEHIRQADFPLG